MTLDDQKAYKNHIENCEKKCLDPGDFMEKLKNKEKESLQKQKAEAIKKKKKEIANKDPEVKKKEESINKKEQIINEKKKENQECG